MRIGQMQGIGNSIPYGINDNGQVVGEEYFPLPSKYSTAYLTAPNQPILPSSNLGSFGNAANVAVSRANVVNSAGKVVGIAGTITSASKAFLYDGAMSDLGTVGGMNWWPLAINDSDVVVGAVAANGRRQDMHAAVSYQGTTADLTTLLPVGANWVLQRAVAINNCGSIVGLGNNMQSGHGYSGFLMTPTQAP